MVGSCQTLNMESWLVPGQTVAFVVDNLAQDRILSEYLSFPLLVLFQYCSILILYHQPYILLVIHSIVNTDHYIPVKVRE